MLLQNADLQLYNGRLVFTDMLQLYVAVAVVVVISFAGPPAPDLQWLVNHHMIMQLPSCAGNSRVVMALHPKHGGM